MKNDFEKFYIEIEDEMISFFKELVETNSYSYNEKGIKKCLEIFKNRSSDFLKVSDLKNNSILLENNDSKEDFILFMGHMDTVFPEDMQFNDFVIEGNLIKGPGTYDMKGGLIVAFYALKFLNSLNLLKNFNIKFLINSDEEIGSLKSKEIIQHFAKRAKHSFVFEGGGEKGEIVVGRKGKIGLKGEVKGEAGHAAFTIKGKKSAILEAAHKIIELEKLNDQEKNISCNVGKINGGTGANTIPDYCEFLIDIRYPTTEAFKNISDKLDKIRNHTFISGTKTIFTKTSERPCMESSKNIPFYNRLKNFVSKYGIDLLSEFRNGVSDANFISETGTSVLDGFGPIGGNDHSDKEYIVKSSIRERILLTSLSVLALSD